MLVRKIKELKQYIKNISYKKIFIYLIIYSGIGSSIIMLWIDKIWNNKAPVVEIEQSSQEAIINKEIIFEGIGSYDAEGGKLKYEWYVDGNKKGEESTLEYRFDRIGPHKIILKVEDPEGLEASKSVFVNIIPPLNVSMLKDALKYYKYKIEIEGIGRKKIAYYDNVISKTEFIEEEVIKIKFINKDILEATLLMAEEIKKIFGLWKLGNRSGEVKIIFNEDYNEGEGEWNYMGENQLHKIRLKKLEN